MRDASPLHSLRFSATVRALEGMSQWRSLLLGFASLLSAFVLASLTSWLAWRGGMAATFLAFIGQLMAMLIVLTGISAVGAMLMDHARGQPIRSWQQALVFGLHCVPKMLGFGLLLVLAGAAFFLVAGVVYWVCKLPLLGPLLAFVAHPLLIITGSVLLVGVSLVIAPLFGPAIWSGLGLRSALTQVMAIACTRWMAVVALQLVLYAIVAITSSLLMVTLLPVSMTLSSLASGIMGAATSLEALLLSGGASRIMGLGMGLGVVAMLACALLWQVMLLGMNLIYVQMQDGVDVADGQRAWDALRQQARAGAQRVQAAAARPPTRARHPMQDLAAQRNPQEQAQAALRQQQAQPERDAGTPTAPSAPCASGPAQAQSQAQAPTPNPESYVPQQPHSPPASTAAQERAAPGMYPPPDSRCPQCRSRVASIDSFCSDCGQALQ